MYRETSILQRPLSQIKMFWKLVSGRYLARSLSASNCLFRAYAETYQMQILIVTLQEDHNTNMLQSIIIIT